MTRYLPYSIRPLRLFGQLISDITISLWTVIWVFVGIAVHDAIATIAEAGRRGRPGRGKGARKASGKPGFGRAAAPTTFHCWATTPASHSTLPAMRLSN